MHECKLWLLWNQQHYLLKNLFPHVDKQNNWATPLQRLNMEKYLVYNTSFCKFKSCLIHPICRGSSYLLDILLIFLFLDADFFSMLPDLNTWDWHAFFFYLSFMSVYNPRLVFFGGNAEGLVVLSPWLSRIVRNNHNQHTWFLPAYLQHLSYKYRWGEAYANIPFIVTLGEL